MLINVVQKEMFQENIYCKTGIFRKGVFFGIFGIFEKKNENYPLPKFFRKTFKLLVSRNNSHVLVPCPVVTA